MTKAKINSKVSVIAQKAKNGRWYPITIRESGRKGVPASYTRGKAIYARPWTARRGGVRAYHAE